MRYHFIDLSPKGSAGYHLAKTRVLASLRKRLLRVKRKEDRKAA